jgi:NADH-quinone oxidoreductase subunit A
MVPYLSLAGYLLIFLIGGFLAVYLALVVGKLLRPSRPEPEKLAVYECGEPTIGTSWVQFDLRFYVVALLFVIFEVEVAFFFPWATVFGTVRRLADPSLTDRDQRAALTAKLAGAPIEEVRPRGPVSESPLDPSLARRMTALAVADLAVFFGIILVGFAYLWKRGDIEWVRSTVAEERPPEELIEAVAAPVEEEAAAGVVLGTSLR